jgi:hypothetical protein
MRRVGPVSFARKVVIELAGGIAADVPIVGVVGDWTYGKFRAPLMQSGFALKDERPLIHRDWRHPVRITF